MARSINSPGVQITETDLSNYQIIAGGTNVFVPGFAAQGPTDEVILITSVTELNQIYGNPTTPAERYFYYTAKEILNSSANVLTSRLPYGSGSGAGFASQYSALLYPVASSASGNFTVYQPTHITIDEATYNNFIQNNITWNTITQTSSAALFSSLAQSVSAGIIILNDSQTSQNEYFEGYYVSLTDNKDIAANTDFTSVNFIYGLSAQDNFYKIPTSRLGFALSGTILTQGANSVSEVIEGTPTWDFSLSGYMDSLILSVFKVRNSTYEPDNLVFSLVENYIGSLNRNRKDEYNKTFYLEEKVNTSSPNFRVFVNPAISKNTDWSGLNAPTTPNKAVRMNDSAKALYTPGVFAPTYNYNTDKYVGNVITKVERALSLVSTTESTLVDIVVDAGLTTIATNVSGGDTAGYYDDTTYQNAITDLSTENSATIQRWRTAFNTFNNFVQNTRKDCMFIADPLRQVFLNGNIKNLDIRTNNFTQSIYTPLKNLLNSVNTNYSAIYGNWVKAYDEFTDTMVWLPASGYMATIYARTDSTTQPWFAPAGLNRGLIGNIVDLAFNPNQKQRDYLYTISVNPIVSFSGDGFVVFGQKTLQNKPSAFDRVNVRRLFLTLERSTQQALKYFVFEPNTEFTRTRLKNTITPIFELAKNTQGVYDYLIVCDERNNTPDLIDRNELAVDIYIKPVKTAEYILVNFIATRTGQNFQELI